MKRACIYSILFALLLTACDADPVLETSDRVDGQGQDSISTTEQTLETALTDTLTRANYEGYSFRIFGEDQVFSGDYFDTEEITGDVIGDNVYQRNRTVEELYNTTLAFETVEWFGGAERIRSLILAGDDAFDLYTCTHLYIGSLVIGNYFIDWQTVDGIDLSLPCYVQDANETYSIGDKTPLLFGDFMETNSMRCWSFLFNQQLADAYALENPYTVVDEGRWTIDYLLTVTSSLYTDLNGDGIRGKEDEYGFITDTWATLDGFSRGLGIRAIAKDENNLPKLNFYNEDVVTGFEKLYSLYWESPGTYASTENMTHVETMFAAGQAVFASTRLDFVMKDAMRDMTDDYGVLPYPKLSEEMEYATYLSGTFSAQMIAITQPTENHSRTGNITHALNVYSHEYVIPAIYEITLKTKTSRDSDSARMLDLIFASRKYSFDSMDEGNFPFSPVNTLRSLIGSKKKDIASYYATNEAKAQTWIDDIIATYNNANS